MASHADLTFQLLSANYTYGIIPRECIEKMVERDASTNETRNFLPVIKLHGRDADGNAIMLNVYGFMPYFYVRALPGEDEESVKELIENLLFDPEKDVRPSELAELEQQEAELRDEIESRHDDYHERQRLYAKLKVVKDDIYKTRRKAERSEHVHSVSRRMARSIMGYTPDSEGDSLFFKVCLYRPKEVAMARDALQLVRNGRRQSFESNVDFCLRLLIDRKICAVDWVKAAECTWCPCDDGASIEPWCHAEDLSRHEEAKHSNLRVLSYDIETEGLDPNKHAVLMIASLCVDMNVDMKKSPARSVTVFTWKPIPSPQAEWLAKGLEDEAEREEDARLMEENSKRDSVTQMSEKALADAAKMRKEERAIYRNFLSQLEIRTFDNETEMMLAWSRYVTSAEVDPDILTGYNILNFDTPFLFNRAKVLGCAAEFCRLNKNMGEPAELRLEHMESKALGKRDTYYANLSGRTQMDMLEVIRREHKLRKYKLDAVAGFFLGIFKADVHYTEIVPMWESNDPARLLKLAVYNLKDVVLPIRLMFKLGKLMTLLETSRVCGVTPQMILKRGQQIKVFTKLLHCARDANFVIPYIPVGVANGKFEGAVVIEPFPGFYNTCVATLDFSGLYPSIMRRWNLCYSTRLSKEQAEAMNPKDYYKTPAGFYFVREHIRKGVLAVLLEDLGKQRNAAKAIMTEAEESGDKLLEEVMNFRQLALKLFANGTYGFCGATVGKLPLLEISESVTAYGRDGLMLTRSIVQGEHAESASEVAVGTALNPYGNRVIYGDTDSVMIDTRIPLGTSGEEELKEAVERAIMIGKALAALVNRFFQKPMQVEFEKVFAPYLLISKKRYAGRHFVKEPRLQLDGVKRLQLIDKLTCKGLEAVRRDNCTAVAMSQEKLIRILLVNRSISEAVKFAQDFVMRLVRGRVDINSLVITKEYSKSAQEYKAPQPHTELIQRLSERDPEYVKPATGDRIAYVIVRHPNDPKANLFLKSEDPDYVTKNPDKCRLDYGYYLGNQLLKPWQRVLDLGMKCPGFTLGMFERIRLTGSPGGILAYSSAAAQSSGDSDAIAALHAKPHAHQAIIKPPLLAKKGTERTIQCSGDARGITRYFTSGSGAAATSAEANHRHDPNPKRSKVEPVSVPPVISAAPVAQQGDAVVLTIFEEEDACSESDGDGDYEDEDL